MNWNNYYSVPLASKLDVASSLTNRCEAELPERGDSLFTRNHRKRGTHAGIRTVVMIGGSIESGRSSPSKYRPNASSRFATASSTVLP